MEAGTVPPLGVQKYSPTVTRTLEAPRSYDPAYSLLGRSIRAWVDDGLRGEALYIVVLTLLAGALLMVHYLGWALLKPLLIEQPSWQFVFWGGQVASILVLAGVGLVGFRPPVRVECADDGIRLEQGDRSCTLARTEVRITENLTPTDYHRHYRGYAKTRAFVTARPEVLLLLQSDRGPIIIELRDETARTHLIEHVTTPRSETPELVAETRI